MEGLPADGFVKDGTDRRAARCAGGVRAPVRRSGRRARPASLLISRSAPSRSLIRVKDRSGWRAHPVARYIGGFEMSTFILIVGLLAVVIRLTPKAWIGGYDDGR